MEVTNLKDQNLYKEFHCIIPYDVIDAKVTEELMEVAKTFKIAGFREGKVPISMVKLRVGGEIEARVKESELRAAVASIASDNNLTPVTDPKITVQAFNKENGLDFKVEFTVMPLMPKIELSSMNIEFLEVSAIESDIEKASAEVIENFKEEIQTPDGYEAKSGDIVQINFDGKIHGKAFEGGSGKGVKLEIGRGAFLEDFEKQLIGVKKSDTKKINIIFPNHYSRFAGQSAVFDIEVLDVFNAKISDSIDEDFAKRIGAENLETLKKSIQEKVNYDVMIASRMHNKRVLFDKLNDQMTFEVPHNLIKADFESIFDDMKKKRAQGDESFVSKSDDELRQQCQSLAERRVRLGLYLTEIARLNNIVVTEEEIKQAVNEQIKRVPAQEKQIRDFYSKKENLGRLEGPILEEKCVDFMFSRVDLQKKNMTSEEFTEYVKNYQS